MTPPPALSSRAFTLVELLAVVAILAVLTAMALPGLKRASLAAAKAADIGGLHQVGAAILISAGENQGALPGPCGIGLLPAYNNASTDLSAQIAPYLGMPPASALAAGRVEVVAPLVEHGARKWHPVLTSLVTSAQAPHYVQNSTLSLGRIFGAFASGTTAAKTGLRISQLDTYGGTSKVWCLSNPDQLVTADQVRKSGWFGGLPAQPVFAPVRVCLYVDGHIQEDPLSQQ